MSEWFERDAFWEDNARFLFGEDRMEKASSEVDQILEHLRLAPGAAILDLCCGPGRHSLELARRGFRVTGVDRTEGYLELARARAEERGLEVELVRSDMREFARPGGFDGAINIYTSFGYFEQERDDLRVLQNLRESLRPGAPLVMDLMGKEVLARKFRERDWSATEDGTLVLEERRILEGWSRVESTWTPIRGTRRQESRLTVRVYSAVELGKALLSAGFSSVELFGDLEGIPYDHEARRLVAVAR